MSEKLKEALSAVMDGEADEFEIRRVLNEASSDPVLRARWSRYHLIGHLVRRETLAGDAGVGGRLRYRPVEQLMERLWRRIDAEAGDEGDAREASSVLTRGQGVDAGSSGSDAADAAAGTAPAGGGPRRGWLAPMTGVAVAASVAVAVVVGFGGLQQPAPEEPLQTVQSVDPTGGVPSPQPERGIASSQQPAVAGGETRQPMGAVASPSPVNQRRTQAYMLHHVHQTSLNYQASVVPFAKVAAFEAR